MDNELQDHQKRQLSEALCDMVAAAAGVSTIRQDKSNDESYAAKCFARAKKHCRHSVDKIGGAKEVLEDCLKMLNSPE